MNRYLRERAALADLEGDLVEVTRFGGPVEHIDNSPTPADYAALARRAYLRDDLTIEQFESVLDIELGLADGSLALVGVGGPEWLLPTRRGSDTITR